MQRSVSLNFSISLLSLFFLLVALFVLSYTAIDKSLALFNFL